jgi:hypothetical protein
VIRRPQRLLNSTERLLFLVTGWEFLIIAFLSIFSGPVADLQIPERLGLASLDPAGRVGRIIMLYHALAIPFIAALVYLLLDLLPLDEKFPRIVRPTITAGYLLTSLGGIGFAYLGWGWIAHGAFIVGLSLVFYAGAVLCAGLFPWRRDAWWQATDGFSVERLAFWLMALYTLISVIIGGVAGSFFGNGFEAFLAEDVIREEHTLGHLAIIAHLHIMLTLIDVALLLIVARTFSLRGRLQKATLWLTVVGATVVSFATWSVMIFEGAHKVINIGSAFLLIPGLIVAIAGFSQMLRAAPSTGGRLRALLGDPIRFGILFELIFVNAVVTVPGVTVAMNLDTYRQPAYLEVERAIAAGHWHVLATLSAVLALFLVVDRLGVKGILRQVVGWGVLLGSTLAFVFVQFYLFRQPGENTDWALPFLDAGIAIFLIALAIFIGAVALRRDVLSDSEAPDTLTQGVK